MAATDYDFNLTRNEIINGALRVLGVLAPGQTPTGEMLVNASEALNTIVKHWQTKSVFLWTVKTASFTQTANTASKLLGNEVWAVERVWYVDTGGDDIPIRLISYEEYNNIPDKAEASNYITVAAMDNNKSTPTMYFWQKPNANTVIKYTYVERLKDMDTAAGNFEGPQHWVRALKYALAADLADDYRKTLQERSFLEGKAAVLFNEARQSNVERTDEDSIEPLFCYRS